MDIIQSHYTLSNKNNGAKLMPFFNIGLSHLISKLFLISNKIVLVPWAKMVTSSNEGLWLQNRKWSRIELSADGFNFFKCQWETPWLFFQVPVSFTLIGSIASFTLKFYTTQDTRTSGKQSLKRKTFKRFPWFSKIIWIL